jgi:Protein of unknown function (DUF3011)
MGTEFIRAGVLSALIIAQTAPAMAQPVPPTAPLPTGPQIQPPRPGTGGPQIQPPRPVGPVPVRPRPPTRPLPPTPPVIIDRPQISPPIYPGQNFAGVLRCESNSNRRRQCNVVTSNRVEIVRAISGNCQRGRSWGFARNYIWVERGCRADFGYGYANSGNPVPLPQPQPDRNRGPSAGAIIAGVVVAGGLIALLASRKKSSTPETTVPSSPGSYPAGPPATLTADLSAMPSAARASVQDCMFDAARQIGVTGGTKLRYERTMSLEPGNGGWRIRASMTATYPDGDRALEMYCRATPTKIVQLDFS